jgi:hypothetical protein
MVDTLKQHLSKIKAPFGGEKVFKDECAFSFDNPVCISIAVNTYNITFSLEWLMLLLGDSGEEVDFAFSLIKNQVKAAMYFLYVP